MTKAKDFVRSYLKELGLVEEEAKLDILTDEFSKRYQAEILETGKSNDTPRQSTAPQSLEQVRDAGNMLIEQEGAALGNYQRRGEILGGLRQQKVDQNLQYLQGATDTKTQAALQLLGGSQRDVINDGLRSKERVVGMKTDYHAGYDSKLLSAIDKIHERENSGQMLDFIGQLAGTAAMLAM